MRGVAARLIALDSHPAAEGVGVERKEAMSSPNDHPRTVVCLASYFKGNEFIRECKRRGWRVILLTREKALGEEWACESLDALITVASNAEIEPYLHAVSDLARSDKPDLVVALEESDVVTAARVREFLCLPGLASATARLFRDKLAMRFQAREGGLAQPEFVHLLNYQEVGEYLGRVPPPWVLKPRADASAIGIRRLDEAEQVWRAKDWLDARECPRERSSYYLLERFIPGEVYHVNSLVEGGGVAFASVDRYGSPPLEVTQRGGVATSHTVDYDSGERRELLELNRRLLAGLGLRRGAAHAEFIRGAADGRFYFLEVAARVGGAYTAEAVEAASGVNLWREWAAVEVADATDSYRPPAARRDYSGIAISLSRQERPDTSAYADPEIVYRVKKPHHVGLIVRSPTLTRTLELLGEYERRFTRDFTAVAPQPARPEPA